MTMLRNIVVGLAIAGLGASGCAEKPGKKKDDKKETKDKKKSADKKEEKKG